MEMRQSRGVGVEEIGEDMREFGGEREMACCRQERDEIECGCGGEGEHNTTVVDVDQGEVQQPQPQSEICEEEYRSGPITSFLVECRESNSQFEICRIVYNYTKPLFFFFKTLTINVVVLVDEVLRCYDFFMRQASLSKSNNGV
ncbi:hypothetical protein CHS0354_039147 [Potamilus streckersoni]|uniref:Uncharacterized protein n=1 Tax=Potamilus streckersoni TaxID=2493646 RepID=A0AAE0VRT0_9BIVA|nr:hypothetical protein CHS0354_039147 [Potamilus streckersoni]